MSRYSWAVLLITYLTGLLSTGLPFSPFILGGVFLSVSMILGLVMPWRWRAGPRRRIWWLAGLVGLFAIAHFQLRQPQPSPTDISTWVNRTADSYTVTGQILEMPRQNRQGRFRFPLRVERLNQNPNVGGKLYVTVPALQGTGLVAGQTVAIKGRLYLPQPAQTPGSFDFQQYLAQQGIFAGLSGQLAAEPEKTPGGFWQVRQRITQALVEGMGSPNGFLVSSMILGRRAVDLPGDVQLQFTQAGLAHTLAASGFHVSLLVGTVLMAVRRCSPKLQLGVGLGTLVLYLSLTGLHPSVVRAALMGIAGLVALIVKRRIRPMGLLLVTATGLLLINPLWIWDVGFQLSFMATAGLVTTLPWLLQQVPWLPPAIATPILIPIAVLFWTLPITLTHFHVMPLYGIILNALTAPLVMVVTLGGMLCGAIAAIVPAIGAKLAVLLWLPTQVLREIVRFSNQLPGSQWHGGTIALWQLGLIYGGILLLLYLRLKHWQRWSVAVSLILVLLIPYAYAQTTRVQFTVLGSRSYPIVIIQDQGQTGLIGLGDRATFDYQLQPFLAQAGVNRLQVVIQAPGDPPEVRQRVEQRYPTNQTLTLVAEDNNPSATVLPVQQTIAIGSTVVQRIAESPPLLQIQYPGQPRWLVSLDPVTTWPAMALEPNTVITTYEQSLIAPLLTPDQIAIAVKAAKPSPEQASNAQHYATATDGVVWWTPQQGLQSGREGRDRLLDE